MEELERWNQRFGAAEYIFFGTAPNALLASHAKARWPEAEFDLVARNGR